MRAAASARPMPRVTARSSLVGAGQLTTRTSSVSASRSWTRSSRGTSTTTQVGGAASALASSRSRPRLDVRELDGLEAGRPLGRCKRAMGQKPPVKLSRHGIEQVGPEGGRDLREARLAWSQDVTRQLVEVDHACPAGRKKTGDGRLARGDAARQKHHVHDPSPLPSVGHPSSHDGGTPFSLPSNRWLPTTPAAQARRGRTNPTAPGSANRLLAEARSAARTSRHNEGR